ncbi:hypothetical protein A7X12_10170 [Sphingomonas sp. TDK1]|nr:hypothetical protein A7X12_10170 [Sphingomonas sp. TDK1]
MRLARAAALALLMLMALLASSGSRSSLPVLLYFLTIALMVGFPKLRSGDIAGFLVSIAILLCFIELSESHSLSWERACTLAAGIGAAIFPFKASRIRRLANSELYRTLADRRDRAARSTSSEASSALIIIKAP